MSLHRFAKFAQCRIFCIFTLTPSTSFSPSALPERLGLSTRQSFKWLIMSSLAIKIQCKFLTRLHLNPSLLAGQLIDNQLLVNEDLVM